MGRRNRRNLLGSDATQQEGVVKCSYGLAAGATQVLVLDSYKNGVAVSVHRAKEVNETYTAASHRGDIFFLRLKELKELSIPYGKFFVFREHVRENLESIFEKLQKSGVLGSTVVYFGVNTDPFHVFHAKFVNTMLCLELLEKYPTARVIVQSRSKMMLSALATLKSLAGRALCSIPMESYLDSELRRYTSAPSGVKERLKTAVGLSGQGVPVCFSVAPILPHGSTLGDTWKFAEMLLQFSDRVMLSPLCNGSKVQEAQVRKSALALKLEADNHFEFLRPDACEALEGIIRQISPKHLEIPAVLPSQGEQLNLFAA